MDTLRLLPQYQRQVDAAQCELVRSEILHGHAVQVAIHGPPVTIHVFDHACVYAPVNRRRFRSDVVIPAVGKVRGAPGVVRSVPVMTVPAPPQSVSLVQSPLPHSVASNVAESPTVTVMPNV